MVLQSTMSGLCRGRTYVALIDVVEYVTSMGAAEHNGTRNGASEHMVVESEHPCKGCVDQ